MLTPIETPTVIPSALPQGRVVTAPSAPRPLHAFPNATPTPPKQPYKYPGRSPSSMRSHSVLEERRISGDGEREGYEYGKGPAAAAARRERYLGQFEQGMAQKKGVR